MKAPDIQHSRQHAECADASVTLVKDTQHLLPLSAGRTPKVLLEILGHFDSNARVLRYLHQKLEKEGFQAENYQHENFENAKFDVHTFRQKYDLVIDLANVENASNKITNWNGLRSGAMAAMCRGL